MVLMPTDECIEDGTLEPQGESGTSCGQSWRAVRPAIEQLEELACRYGARRNAALLPCPFPLTRLAIHCPIESTSIG